MNKISDRTKMTLVKIFINTLTSMSLVTSPLVASAQTTPATTTPATTTPAAQPAAATPANATAAALAEALNGGNPETKAKERCDGILEKINDSNRKIADACRKSGLGGSSNCVEKSKSCGEALEEEDFDFIGEATKGLGTIMGNQSLGAGLGSLNKECPQLNGRDYFTEKEKIEDQLKDLKGELADLDKEKGEAQKEYDDTIKDIQKDLAEAQEDAKAKNLEVDDDLRKQISDFQTSQAAAAKDMRAQGTTVMTLRGQLISLDRQKAQELLNLTDFTAKTDCKRKMLELNNAYKAVSSGTSGGHITRAKAKKAELIETYNKCMVGFSEKRKNLNETFKQQRDLLEKKIVDTESDVTAIEDGLKQSEAQLEQIKGDANTKKANALQAVIDLGTRSQADMEAAFKQLQAANSSIAKKEQSLNESLTSANNSLLTLGPAPKRGTEYSPSDASSEIDSEIETLRSYSRNDCTEAQSAAESALKKLGESTKKSGRK